LSIGPRPGDGADLVKRMAAVVAFAIMSVVASQSTHAAECRTPAEYAAAFESGADCAVGSCLYSVITQAESAPTHPYPDGFAKAWLSGYRTLAAFLQLRREKGPQCGLTGPVLNMVGFAPPYSAAPYRLNVIDGCALQRRGHVVGIPTVAEWVRELKDAYGIEIPMPVFRRLVEDGMDFESATGCSGRQDPARACVSGASFPDEDTCSCSSEFVDAYRKLRDLSPYQRGQTTSECFGRFQALPSSVPALRAALWACQDVNPYNTFNGLGFDGDELTLPEFIVDNVSFAEMGADNVTAIPLPDPAPCTER
jgi:hypothetical protein